ncbi:MAG: hypothetical protein ACOYK9_00280 [Chlamydiia bacterium]
MCQLVRPDKYFYSDASIPCLMILAIADFKYPNQEVSIAQFANQVLSYQALMNTKKSAKKFLFKSYEGPLFVQVAQRVRAFVLFALDVLDSLALGKSLGFGKFDVSDSTYNAIDVTRHSSTLLKCLRKSKMFQSEKVDLPIEVLKRQKQMIRIPFIVLNILRGLFEKASPDPRVKLILDLSDIAGDYIVFSKNKIITRSKKEIV